MYFFSTIDILILSLSGNRYFFYAYIIMLIKRLVGILCVQSVCFAPLISSSIVVRKTRLMIILKTKKNKTGHFSRLIRSFSLRTRVYRYGSLSTLSYRCFRRRAAFSAPKTSDTVFWASGCREKREKRHVKKQNPSTFKKKTTHTQKAVARPICILENFLSMTTIYDMDIHCE